LLDSFVNAQRLVGADKATILQMPKDDDAAKGWDDVWNRWAARKAPTNTPSAKKADGSDYDDVDKAFQKEILPVLHQAGITQRQFDKIRPAIDALAAEQPAKAPSAHRICQRQAAGRSEKGMGRGL
jgi:hypothetical protein